MFYDTAKIYLKAGSGGNGVVAFRREKYVPQGGPSGGDGGKGGDIILVVDTGLRTLVDFKYRQHYKAERGEHGQGSNRHGKNGEDLVLRVPPGTIVRDAEAGVVLADMTGDGQVYIAARGGRGGRGNARFATASNRAPSLAEQGEPGEERWISLELRLLADVGLLGLPNAGKSTLLARISAAKPKIADYPFTTLTPNLGVVQGEDGASFVVADIPGLIEGAHHGAGLGHDFLRHLQRTRILVHVVDVSGSTGGDVQSDYMVIRQELAMFDPDLAGRPVLVAANKIDLAGAQENLPRLREVTGDYPIYPISAVTGLGVRELILGISRLLAELPPVEFQPLPEEMAQKHGPAERFRVTEENGLFTVSGREVERHLAMTYLDSEEGLRRFQRILKVMGVEDALRQKGAKNGDLVRIGDVEFEFVE